MRLIDADEEIKHLEEITPKTGLWDSNLAHTRLWIQQARTIDAIPIEWIIEYIVEIETNSECTKQDQRILQQMIEDWKKDK